MTYIERLNAFNLWLESNALEPVPQLLYFKLLNVFNRAGWPEYVQVDNQRLASMAGQKSEKSAITARDKLVAAGLISYERGKKGIPGRYSLTDFYCKKYSENNSVKNIHCIFFPNTGGNPGSNPGVIREENVQPYKDKEQGKDKDEEEAAAHVREDPSRPLADPPGVAYYRDQINPTASSRTYEEIAAFERALGGDLVKLACDKARDARALNATAYVRTVLTGFERAGYRTVAEVEDAERRRVERGELRGRIAGSIGAPLPGESGRNPGGNAAGDRWGNLSGIQTAE